MIATSTAGIILTTSSFASSPTRTTTAVTSGHAPVNGLSLYYEIHGAGEPLILLHGGVGGVDMFGPNLAALAEKRKVIAVELQGQGRTADIDRPLSFEAMADDIAALMNYLGIEKADLLGYSLGGGVALQTVIRHPESVRKLVILSAPFKRDGWYPEVLAAMAKVDSSSAGQMKQSPMYQLYPNVNWRVLFTKLGDLLRQDYDWSEGVATITSPTMIAFADADAVHPMHVMEFFGLLGGGQRDAGWGFCKTRGTARDSAGPDALQHQLLPRARAGRNPVSRLSPGREQEAGKLSPEV